MKIFDRLKKQKMSPELKTALVLASVTSSWTLGYCYDKKIVSDKEIDFILAARKTILEKRS
jgi:hypothetical protein